MGRFKLSAGFTMIPEGEHVFKITSATYDEDFGKLEVRMVTKNGATHTERYNMLNSDGSTNDSAMRAFGFLAQSALNDYSEREIDEQDLVGHYFKAEVIHRTGTKTNAQGEPMKFVNLGNKTPASGFEGDVPVKETPAPQKAAEVKPEKQVNSVADMMAQWGL